MMSKTTKKYKNLHILFYALSIASVLLPLIIYIIIGYATGTRSSKITLTITCMIGICLSAVNILFKYRVRCSVYFILIGVYYSLDNFLAPLLILGITTALDEFLFNPLAKYYKDKFIINKEIDARKEE